MKNPWRLIGYGICGVVGIWLAVRLFLPVGLPFLLGYGLSALAERPVRLLSERAGFPRRLAAFLVTVLLSAALLYLLPLLLFLIGYLAAYTLGGWSAAICVGGFVLGLLPAVVYDRKLKKRPPAYTIIGFVK